MPDILLLSVLLNLAFTAVLIVIFLRNRKNIAAEVEKKLEKTEKALRDEFARSREDFMRSGQEQRAELRESVKFFGGQVSERMNELAKVQKLQLSNFEEKLSALTESNEKKFDRLENRVSENLKNIQDNNALKLEEMRKTVDEKLHDTLEKRLGNSFKLVSERLELVHKGLGEMQNLATGVGDLKKVLTNVKTRGTWGEVQLQNLIEQVLAPGQYEKNVAVKKGSGELVEFAVKLPGRENGSDTVWLPIDAKFPLEDYQRLTEARDAGNPETIEACYKAIEARIKGEAKKINLKYICPPSTTDFAVMFIPIEGLYAEILSRPGLAEFLQREYRVVVSGPTTLAALLNSLQMGFRTLAIEKRSGEVWKLLGIIKGEFAKFGDILDKTQQKLDQASKTIGDATKKTRTIQRKLNGVEELPAPEEINNLMGDSAEYD